jgi:hypothetical protein
MTECVQTSCPISADGAVTELSLGAPQRAFAHADPPRCARAPTRCSACSHVSALRSSSLSSQQSSPSCAPWLRQAAAVALHRYTAVQRASDMGKGGASENRRGFARGAYLLRVGRSQERVSSRLKLLPIFSTMSEQSLHKIVSADLFQFVRRTYQEVLFSQVRTAHYCAWYSHLCKLEAHTEEGITPLGPAM